MKKLVFMLSTAVICGCAQLVTVDPVVHNDWDRTLYYARADADSGNYFAADKLLDEFVRLHPDTRAAKEIGFWKATYIIDPANPGGSLAGGIAALDNYLASTDSTGRYVTEAIVLRRTAAAALGVASMDSTPAPAATVTSTATTTKDTVVVGSKSRDEEIASLKDQLAKSKDELAKVSAELDRIKKRLANPEK
ncbi:MAG: hypothetical protein ACREMS_09475 [Gemmatimonadaceae bacterium]